MNKRYMSSDQISNIFIISMMCILFTQFRLFNLPIGIGEIGLLVLGVIVSYEALNKKIYIFGYLNHTFILFWLGIFALLFISYLWVNIMNIHHSDTNVFHDILAYGFILYCIMLFIMLERYYKIDFNIIMERMTYYTVLFYGVLLGFSLVFGDFINITGYYPGVARYMGLSHNPNQVALLFTIIPFMILFYYKEYKTSVYLNKDINILLLLLSLFIIYYISSRGLILGMVIGIFLIVLLSVYKKFNTNVIFSILMLILVLSLLLIIIYYYNNSFLKLLFINGLGSFTHRLELWANAIDLFQASPIIGFGPGAHVSTVVDPTHYWEVHNSFLDLLLQVGLMGLFAYVILLFNIGKNLIKNGNILLFSAFCVLILFSTVHFVLRHPIFWFYLFYFYQEGKAK